MADKVVRTRFAPSPTGYLHVGGVRTALFAWLVAKQAGGQFVLRIEDTDRDRHVEGSEQHIIESLNWLGLKPDEGPFRQSQRLDIYKGWAKKLIDTGRAYADTTSSEELDKLRLAAKTQKRPFLFRDHRPQSPPAWRPGQPLRFKSEPKQYHWHDEVMGDLSSGPESIDDFILIKSDGFPTYNFAHIVDDHLMHITHVIRSQEFLPSVPKFLNLYEALGIGRPKLATLPYVLGPDGHKKLSKRDGAKDILDYRREGYLPEALNSFLATLGWNDGTEQEIFTVKELIKKFSLARVQHSGARFDEKRLEWVDGHFIRKKPLDELYGLAEPFWPDSAKGYDNDYKKAVLGLVQERLKHLSELPELTSFFFEDQPKNRVLLYQEIDPRNQKEYSLIPKNNAEWMKKIIESLSQSDFSEKDLTERLNDLLDALETSPPILFKMLSIALTGSYQYPSLPGMLHVLGPERTIARLKSSLEEQA